MNRPEVDRPDPAATDLSPPRGLKTRLGRRTVACGESGCKGRNGRLRVLLLAEACNPQSTSVPLQAYYRYAALRQHVDVTLVTQIRNRSGFENHGGDHQDIIYIDSEPVAAPLYKLGKIITCGHSTALGTQSAISCPAYLYFEHLVWRRFRDDLLSGRYDLVHRLTPVSPTFPSPIAKKCPIPFVLGPLNGALPWPRGTKSIRWREGEFLVPLRRLYRALPYVRQTYERADLILTATRYVEADLPYRARRRCVRFPGNGVDAKVFNPGSRVPAGQTEPFTVLFVGRLIPIKNPAIVVESIARSGLGAQRRVHLIFAGAGPEAGTLRELVQSAGLTEQTTFAGWVPHEKLPDLYRKASVLALPSIHESGGAVLVEAMACGLPSIVVDYGGPAEYISTDVGIRVPLGSHDEMVHGFASALKYLYENPEHLDCLSAQSTRLARRRWCWDAHARQLVSLYQSLLGRQ